MFCWVSKYFDDKNQLTSALYSTKLTTKDYLFEHLNIIGVSARRDSSQENPQLLSDSYKFLQLVSVIDDEEEDSIEQWGKAIPISLNKCRNDFKYPSIF